MEQQYLPFYIIFFGTWIILSFGYLMAYSYWLERKEDKYVRFTYKDIGLCILFLPLTVLFLVIFCFFLGLDKIGLFTLKDKLADFMNTPIKFKGDDNND
jgi:hypothetical protein